MSRKSFVKSSKQQDERLITRVQEQFDAGSFTDIPASEIPENGVAELKNFVNMGGYLIGRGGSKKRSTTALPSLSTGFSSTSTVSTNTRTVTNTTATKAVDSITKASGVELKVTFSTAHGLVDGEYVVFAGVGGMIELNGETYQVSIASTTAVYLRGTDGDDFTVFTSGGTGQQAFSSLWVGAYYVRDDGNHERITAVNSATELECYTSDTTDTTADSAGWIRGAVNGLLFHKTQKKIVLLIYDDVYIAEESDTGELDITSWTKAHCMASYSTDKPSNGISVLDEIDNNVIIFNPNGIFKLDLSTTSNPNYYYYKVNSKVPTELLNDTDTERNAKPYGRKRLYTMSMLSGTDTDRARRTSGVVVLQESGTVAVGADSKDYGTHWTALPIDSTNTAVINPPQNPIIYNDGSTDYWAQHWTHYSVYATLDVGKNGTDPISGEGNNKELFVWLYDIPICKALIVSTTGTAVVATSGTFNDIDANGMFYILNGADTFELAGIASVTDSTHAILDDALAVDASGSPAMLGSYAGDNFFGFTQSGNLITVSANSITGGFVFSSADVGKVIHTSSGARKVITEFIDTNKVNVADSETIASLTCGCIDPYFRTTRDLVPDSELRARISGWVLPNRFWEPLPAGNTGISVPGFLFSATRDSNFLYYSQIPTGYLYLAGYYNPAYQYTSFKDNIRAFGEFTDQLAVYCANSTHIIPINVFDTVDVPEVGETVVIISGQNVADSSIGVLDFGSIQNIGRNEQIMITSEPGIRVFNGVAFSQNIAEDRIVDVLKSLQSATASSYDPINGYIFWGLE